MSLSGPFLFDPRAFWGDEDVKLLSWSQIGVYMALLSHQWEEGDIPEDRRRARAAIAGGEREKVPDADLDAVFPFFGPIPGEPGRLRNERLHEEREAWKAKKAARSAAGKASGAARRRASAEQTGTPVEQEPNICSTGAQQMPNRSVSSSSSSSSYASSPDPETRTTRGGACAGEASDGEDASERQADLDPCACLCTDPDCPKCKSKRDELYGGDLSPPSTYALTVFEAHRATGKAEEKWGGPQHADLDVAEEWERAGVHVGTACRVIAEVGQTWKKRAGPIRSLAAYRPAMRTAIDLARHNASIMGEKRAKTEADEAWLEQHRAVIQAQEEADQEKANAEKERKKKAEREAAARRAAERREMEEAAAERHAKLQAKREEVEPPADLDTARRRALEAMIKAQ